MTTSTLTSERIDDIPLPLHELLAMPVDTSIDAVRGPPHQTPIVFGVGLLQPCV